ncbi:MAG: 2-oxo acid dehydrogenase subunit E2, partial [Candidatus Eremiobacteraeota bacterium]|nr:2-oxo acid dehydrogenase subunit E2 [Candidatus Eremiobacteraeota bacterium]
MIGATVAVPLPEMGESVTEGSIVEWRKRVGDWVDAGETLVEVTTDKVDVEVPAPAAGVVTKVLAGEGATVAVGTPLAEIDTSAQRPAGVSPASAPKPDRSQTAPEAVPSGNGASAPAAATPSGLATPQAERVAERHGIDVKSIRGSGPDGLVMRHDVDLALEKGIAKAPSLPPPPLPRDAKVTTLKGPVGTLASYMEQSLAIPTATSFRTIGVGTLDVRRKQLNDALAAAGKPQKVSFTHLIAFALVRATRDVPGMTSSFRRENGAPQRIDAPANLGLAVDAERKDGTRFLVVPVIKDADKLDFAAFRAKYEELVGKARENKLTADELAGATFTLTNPGGIGTVASVPRLMAGQGAIIATGAIGYPPGFTKSPAQTLQLLGIEKVMTMTSTYDHRVIQGAQSGEYLRRVEQLLNDQAFYSDVFGSFALSAPVSTVAALEATASTVGTAQSEELLRGASAGQALVSNYRIHGHMAANLDPLGSEPPGDPGLDPRTYNLTPAIMSAIPATVLHTKVGGNSLAEIVPRLRDTYAGQIAYQIEHISNREQRRWLRDYIESGLNRVKLSPERKIQILGRLTKVESMEPYMRKTFLGQKTFS